METKQIPPLHTLRVERTRATINRAFLLVHSLMLLALLYYRASWFFFFLTSHSHTWTLTLTWFLLFTSELTLSFIWLLGAAYRWCPVSRTAFPERLSDDSQLPRIDVFICTADPVKEPPLDVMNTVVSAMALDYPTEKLWVYLSDDGGADITLYAMRKAFSFAMVWLPFCRKYGVRTRCPNAYFSMENDEDDGLIRRGEFWSEREKMKFMYEAFKEKVQSAKEMGLIEDDNLSKKAKADRAPSIEVIGQNGLEDHDKMPHLVYVRLEKRPTHPHHFKAGALNVLLRVSSLLSNGSYILVLDCDMYSNDPTSAKVAMCFHLDPTLSPSLAFVQFPQMFHNISPNDIYCGQFREVFKVWWNGSDGLNGPNLIGSCFYIKREALYGTAPGLDVPKDLIQRRQWFGHSNELLRTLLSDYKCNVENGLKSNGLLQEAHLLASCNYEKGTKWGKQVGFYYDSVAEDYMTGFRLHCKGWNSVYYDPPRPQFLGSTPNTMNDCLVQYKRWSSGLLEVAFSRYCPLTYGIMSGHSILHTMCISYWAFLPLYSIFALCYATVPQLGLLNGISLYPKVSDPRFALFATVFISGSFQHLFEVLHTGGSFRTWWNELRIWMIRSVSSNFFGCLDIATRLIGVKRVDFGLTSKVAEEDQVHRYAKGVFDFQGAGLILVPVVTSSILNMAALIGGVWRVIVEGNYSALMVQLFLTLLITISSYPIIEGFAIRGDAGRVPPLITFLSIICTMVLLSLGFIVFTM
ncbi:cellulose synthase-like protein G2 [Cinnamomum micranthum f. kanehirae]|uniref:Cellulose synthase-like protein G2 n=1 Tax=Cinnamomum micranthum f. kanehirae TaxID=337451 RepID=A0A443P4L6_9MAGN|nr:cellulose synthase-like protein G2 [Cinnamomum micranthum f. kanehirae]